MFAAVADTHTLIWYLYADNRLSTTAKQFMDTAALQRQWIGVCSITLIEMVYLIEKGRIAAESFSRLTRMLETATGQFKEIPVDLALARALMHVNVQQIPDMPDRLIAASAFLHQVPVISRDRKIVSSKLVTIW